MQGPYRSPLAAVCLWRRVCNPAAIAANLSAYTLRLSSNGSATPTQWLALAGLLPPGTTYVLRHVMADDAHRTICFEGERQKGEKVSDFRQAMRWLIGQAESATPGGATRVWAR
jgi:hypothetical protein